MRAYFLYVSVFFILNSCSSQPSTVDVLLQEYIASANAHDFATLEQLLSDDVVWHLGLDTLRGKPAVMRPLQFDKGAQTRLLLRNPSAHGDTVDFELVETNLVLQGLGIPRLTHYSRFIYRNGKIVLKDARRPPLEVIALTDSVVRFSRWLRSSDSTSFSLIWNSHGQFKYSYDNGVLMSKLTKEWQNRTE